MICSIIIPHHDRKDHLEKLLSRITCEQFEIIIESGGTFAENCNRGAKKATTNHLIFCNDDCLPTIENLKDISASLLNYDIVGSTQVYRKGKIFGIGFDCRDTYLAEIKHKAGLSVVPSGFLFGIRKAQFELLGGFNEAYKNGYEDADLFTFALIKELTFKILDLEVYHHISQSEGRMDRENENMKLYYNTFSQEILKYLYENSNYCI